MNAEYKIVIENYRHGDGEFVRWVHDHGGFLSDPIVFGFTTVFLTEEEYIMYLLKWS